MTIQEFYEKCRNPKDKPPREAKDGHYWAYTGEWNSGNPIFIWQEVEYVEQDEDGYIIDK